MLEPMVVKVWNRIKLTCGHEHVGGKMTGSQLHVNMIAPLQFMTKVKRLSTTLQTFTHSVVLGWRLVALFTVLHTVIY